MLRVGLTGGIGCGKTTVADIFSGYGIPVIDADQKARDLTARGEPALTRICEQLGTQILNADGTLDRSKLRQIIFSDPDRKRTLEKILHPLIYAGMQASASKLQAPYCIFAIPLLFETQAENFVDRILVVDCTVELQIQRVKGRDGLSNEAINTILGAQVSREFRCLHADDLLNNSEDHDKLTEQVEKLHNFYLSLSACQTSLPCD